MKYKEIKLTRTDKRYLNYLQHCAYYGWLSTCKVEGKAIQELIAEAYLEGKSKSIK